EKTLLRQLNNKVQEQIRLMKGSHTPDQAAAIEEEITKLREQLQQLESQIRKENPHYAELEYPQPLSLREIQKLVLDKDTVLLEYALGKEHSYLWMVTATSLEIFTLPKRSEVEDSVQQVYQLITLRAQRQPFETSDEQNANLMVADVKYPQVVAALSDMLLKPVLAKLNGKRLLIVLDGALHYLPFGILPVDQVGTPLLNEHDIISLPSASTLAVLRCETTNRQKASKAIAVLADPVFDIKDERVAKKQDNQNTSPTLAIKLSNDRITRSATQLGLERSGTLARLRFTREEALSIKALVADSKIALDFDANLKTASSLELSEYRIIHFATHGFLNGVNPELSGLALSMVDHNGQPQVGFLSAQEVFNLNLPAELVVLSACSTGLGKQIRGEGLIGLTRSFMYAGAARVLVSLWNVDDKVTAVLMKRFYQKLFNENKPPVTALRETQLEISKEPQWQSPYYWAGFILQGEWK
ncbi:MAG: CHAT domain-containing protein, partial [Acidobacteriota bacterium]